MEQFILSAFYGEKKEEYASYEDEFDYRSSAQKYFDMKKSEGKPLTDADQVFYLAVVQGVVVQRAGFKKLMQSLRAHDEIGLSNDVCSAMEEISDEKTITAVALGNCSGQTTDFGEYHL